MSRKEEARREEAKKTQMAIFAMHCDGCPYRDCAGSLALMDYDQYTERKREEALSGYKPR